LWPAPGVRTVQARLASESRKTVLLAVGANVVIGVAKAVAGLFTGSSAMLAEAAHSAADTMNEVFMLVSLSLGKRKPDAEHPFGYGKERFFWAFMAAVFMFVAGACFSIAKGIHDIVAGAERSASTGWFVAAYVVLCVAFAAEGSSFLRARWQIGRQARTARMPLRKFVWKSKDPTVKVVLLEDSAALIGIAIAAAGLGLYHATGNRIYDGIASIAIGLLLAAVALSLGADTKGLLLGEAALPRDRETIQRIIESHPGVDRVLQVLTMALGPDAVLVAARIHLRTGLDSNQIERTAWEIDQALRQEVPSVTQVFLDPTSHREPAPPLGSAAEAGAE
jgi:cation diffusion facilitator family transporter